MKIYQKLTLGFLGTSILLGITGALSVKNNLVLKEQTDYTFNSSLVEVEASAKMIRAVKMIQLAAHELLTQGYKAKSHREVLELQKLARKQADRFEENLALSREATRKEIREADSQTDEAIRSFETNLEIGRRATEFGSNNSSQNFERISEKEEEVILQKIEEEFNKYKQLIERYSHKVSVNVDDGYAYFNEEVESHFQGNLLPLLDAYQEDALEELNEETEEIRETIDRHNERIEIVTGLTLLLSVGLGLFISRSICAPIWCLNDAALKIARGKMDLRVKLDSQDELGVLANAFNSMVEGLKQTTVSKSYLDNIINSMADSLIVINTELKIVRVNQTMLGMLGYEEGELIGKNIRFIIPHDAELENQLSQLHNLIDNWETKYFTKKGKKIPVAFSSTMLYDSDGKIEGIICVARDITERYEAQKALQMTQEKLRYQASHDKLTGLPNRAHFVERLERLLKLSQNYPQCSFAILFLDLDGFKLINDSLGHLAGDRLLKEIARRLEKCLRSKDSISRLGGDEFAIILENVKDIKDITKIADRIQKELESPFMLEGREIFASTSIGIALSSGDYESIQNLLRDADTAMYHAKASGKARYAIFDRQMHAQIVNRLNLENDLRRALERRQFHLRYQPIVDLITGRIASFEALLRWQDSNGNLIPPNQFIPIAEETGLIGEIGMWVLQEACIQMQHWQEQYEGIGLKICVNISPKQLSHPHIVHRIKEILQTTAFNSSYLRLEITESAIIENPNAAISTLKQIKALGISLSMDDFGTGYSSLSYLHRFPFDALKIDRSFVNGVEADSDKLELTRTIVNLAQNLGMKAIAEGVETPAQLQKLLSLNCEYAQGYLFSQPVTSEVAEALIAREHAPTISGSRTKESTLNNPHLWGRSEI